MKKLPEAAAVRNTPEAFSPHLPTGYIVQLVTNEAQRLFSTTEREADQIGSTPKAVETKLVELGVTIFTVGKKRTFLVAEAAEAVRALKTAPPASVASKPKKAPPARAATDDDTAIANGLRLIGGGK